MSHDDSRLSSMIRLCAAISAAGRESSARSMSSLTKALSESLSLRAAAIYALSADGSNLDLVAQWGLNENDLVGTTHEGTLALKPEFALKRAIQVFSLPAEGFKGHTASLCARYGIKHIVVAPLTLAVESELARDEARIGAVCAYLKDTDDSASLVTCLS